MAITTPERPRVSSTQEINPYPVGPGTLMGRYLRSFWQPLCISSEVLPGRGRPVHLLGEDFTVYRGETGQAHVCEFRCAHRRSQLSIGYIEGDNIRCRYHGWVYGANGQCVEQPGEINPFCEKIKIKAYPTIEYLGLIHAYLGEGEPPPFRRFPLDKKDGVVEVLTYVRRCSFLNNSENDGLHVYFTHPRPGYDFHDWKQTPTFFAEETDFGLRTWGTRPDGGRTGGSQVMPNISYRPYRKELGDTIPTTHIAWRVPIDDRTHRSFLVEIVHLKGEEAETYKTSRNEADLHPYDHTSGVTDQVLAGELSLDEVGTWEDFLPASLSNVQDGCTQEGQGAIPDLENEHLGASDASVVVLRQIWARELRNLAQGIPPKQWTLPPVRDASAEASV